MEDNPESTAKRQTAETAEEDILLFGTEEKDPETLLAEKKERRGLLLLIGLMVIALVLAVLWTVLDPLGTGKAKQQAEAEAVITEPLPYGTTDLYVPDIGNAACALLVAPDGKTLLVDCGDEKHWDDVDDMLQRLCISRIDMLILTHMHDGSVGALPALLDTYPVGAVYMSDQSNATDACKKAMRALDGCNCPVNKIALSPSDTGPMDLAFADNLTVTVLSPFEGTYIDANDFSLMLRVSYGNTSVLFTGDAGIAEEKIAVKALADRYFRATVLKVAQNGDSDATGENFLKSVHPAMAVIQAKEAPDDKTLKRLNTFQTEILRTDTAGEIHIALDGFAARVVE